jgi:hypothetical protein
LLAHGQWFSPASSTTKTGRHDIAEILLKVALNTKNQIKSRKLIQKDVMEMFCAFVISPYAVWCVHVVNKCQININETARVVVL